MGWRGSLGGVPTPLVVLYPPFAPSSSEVAFGFLVFLHLLAHNLPQLCMHMVVCSPLELVFVALGEICPGAKSTAALATKRPGPSLSEFQWLKRSRFEDGLKLFSSPVHAEKPGWRGNRSPFSARLL